MLCACRSTKLSVNAKIDLSICTAHTHLLSQKFDRFSLSLPALAFALRDVTSSASFSLRKTHGTCFCV
jgi:hypothetical protein